MNTRTSITLAAGLAATLLLAGCSATGGGSSSSSSMTGMTGMTHPSGAMTASTAAGHNSADLAFAEAMVPHHAQAVQMSDILLKKTGVNASVTSLAKTIKAEQTPEITELNGFLSAWGQPTVPPTPMSMGGMSMGDGMMSDAEMNSLEQANGATASRLFLQQMTQHHKGAITMAETEVRSGEDPAAITLAKHIITGQSSELTTMADLLKQL